MHRLYFSHSYDPEDLRFNEHLWKLLMAEGFHAWIDTGRDILRGPNAGQPGARRPMDVGFNEWMMSQCDGFVAIAPSKRESAYQLLEYRLAVRMGLPRLVALQQDGSFNAPDHEIVSFATSWHLFWQQDTQSKLKARIEEFAKLVGSHKAAGEVLQTSGHWRPRQNSGRLKVALLAPRRSHPEWQDLQTLLQENDRVDWTLLSPANIRIERRLLDERFDLLVVDVGPNGTPQEALGYIHAIGIPQVRVCRVNKADEVQDLGRFLGAGQGLQPRSVYEQDPPDRPTQVSIPRLLDGLKLDAKMQPVIFWTTAREAADQILDTTRRILMFRSGLSPEKGGIAESIDTRKSAKTYFDQYWKRAGRGSVFISFAGHGGASMLADRLAQILRFQNLRCFHYRDKDSSSDARLESGEDVDKGLERRINEVDIVVYLIEESFVASPFCRRELDQGRRLRDQGLVEFRAYSLDTPLGTFPSGLAGVSVHNFRAEWTDTIVEQTIVDDVENSAAALGWALREEERETLASWLKQDERYSIDAVSRLLQSMRVPDSEIRSIADAATGDAWLDAVLRVPRERGKQMRARQIVALLLMAITEAKPARRKAAADWMYARRLLQWPPLVASESEYHFPIEQVYIRPEPELDLTIDAMKTIGQALGQRRRELLSSIDRPLCLTAQTDFLTVPVEWVCESQDDEPLGVRRPVRWRLPDVDGRACVFDSIAENAIPPTALILALAGPVINPQEQMRRLNQLLRSRYEALGWPPEFVDAAVCRSVGDVLSRLKSCQEQVVHIAGHMGKDGLQVGGERVAANDLTRALRESDVRLVVLNGCEGGRPASPVASAYLTLADRLIRDAGIPEVVAHRCKISEEDALAFAEAFHTAFFNSNDGFGPASSAVQGRKAGPTLLRYSPVVISQRELAGSHADV
jgi:hypothetical protein